MTDRQILDSLKGKKCDGCGGRKAERRSFCSKCYYALPKTVRTALYADFGDGYQEAFRAALEHFNGYKKQMGQWVKAIW